MKFYINILFTLLLATFLTTCGLFEKEEIGDGLGDLDKLTPAEVMVKGWEAWQAKNYTAAEKCFSHLLKREDGYLLGHYGLGWTYMREYKYLNSKNEFHKFMTTDSLGVFAPSDSIFRNVRYGQIITHSAMAEHQDVVTLSTTLTANTPVNNNWRFGYDKSIDIIDIRLFRAMSCVALGQLSSALDMIKLIDPLFDTDLTTVEGRIKLINKLNELINLYG